MLDDAESEVRNLDKAVSGPLRIGTTPSVLPALLPHALTLLQADGANMIEVVEGLDQTLGPQLQTGVLDLIVGPVNEPFAETPDILEVELLIDPFCIAVGLDSPFASRDNVSLHDLAGEAWVFPREGSTYRRHVEALFPATGVSWPRNSISANALHLLESMVCFGNCVTVVSPVQLRMPVTGFKVLALDHGSCRRIGYKTRKSGRLSSQGENFLEALAAAATRMAEDFRFLGLDRAN